MSGRVYTARPFRPAIDRLTLFLSEIADEPGFMAKRQGNNPKRRILPAEETSKEIRDSLKQRLRYAGNSLHKLRPGNYGLTPPQNPRPSKSVCDDLRRLLLDEARLLFETGIELGMISSFEEGNVPKYVWAVDDHDEPYEAKTTPGRDEPYYGYRLGDDDLAMRRYVLDEWKKRCRKTWR